MRWQLFLLQVVLYNWLRAPGLRELHMASVVALDASRWAIHRGCSRMHRSTVGFTAGVPTYLFFRPLDSGSVPVGASPSLLPFVLRVWKGGGASCGTIHVVSTIHRLVSFSIRFLLRSFALGSWFVCRWAWTLALVLLWTSSRHILLTSSASTWSGFVPRLVSPLTSGHSLSFRMDSGCLGPQHVQ